MYEWIINKYISWCFNFCIIDYVDLDSHYNLDPDPSEGATMIDGITMNDNKPGHGSKLKTENYA